MVVPGQGGDKINEKPSINEKPPEQALKEISGVSVPTNDMAPSSRIEEHGFTSNENVLKDTFTPSNSEIMARNASEELASNLKTAQEMIKTSSVHPTLAPDMEETVKNVEALLTKCGAVMGDEAAASVKQMA